jgi:hypothetical protein
MQDTPAISRVMDFTVPRPVVSMVLSEGLAHTRLLDKATRRPNMEATKVSEETFMATANNAAAGAATTDIN